MSTPEIVAVLIGLLGATLIGFGIFVAVKTTNIAEKQTEIAEKATDRTKADVAATGVPSGDEVGKYISAIAKLPAGDRLVLYGIAVLVIAGLIGGWLDFSANASAGERGCDTEQVVVRSTCAP